VTEQGISGKELEALLDFYTSCGIDCLIGEESVDRFALSAMQSQVAAAGRQWHSNPGVQSSARQDPETGYSVPAKPDMARETSLQQTPSSAPPAIMPDEAAVSSARELAARANDLNALRACLEAFEGCNLRRTAKTLVFSDGNPEARVMFVGEAPGRDEDQIGKPFVGRSGQLLDLMLRAIGLDRSEAYIANVVPWRPPGNRTPTPQETEICKPFIARQIELAQPEVLVFLGAASAKTFLNVQDGIRRLRGRWMTYPGKLSDIQCIATYHPAYLLRNPIEKRLSWRDFLAIKAALSGSD